ncbi:MAG: lysine 2,3-aminomutase [Trichodesmium sp. St16_bin4-tuft]|nr:lysine 2,3-aminomutase [Trichodesmium sp. St5_bin8]MDE5077322.1 lysine 2,3-aminomutase [Trichodesmium sp. St2_bin6]MDE5091442.1 lysine 2,3-aminomutase [Trichodesmium sp. St18_bin3_1_1]MDE5100151.1 lysine 2,3-aminomutase [Trichodesmium sp. St16_bin4-tuft]MDE5102244.1 lysine 2,3-aminomutase [Trichodesmium sp. St19_bin2]
MSTKIESLKIRFYGVKNLDSIPQLSNLSKQDRLGIKAVAQVLPFLTNNYILEQLIDWNNVPNDPMFRLTFPHPEMLESKDYNHIIQLLTENAPKTVLKQAANKIRQQLNPHPSGQKQHNVPTFNSEPVPGIQHKYRETVLVFPTAGQTCHAYCTFCFRWPQFVGLEGLKFATRESGMFQQYLQQHQEVRDVLFTGGDPMTMKARQLSLYIDPLLEAKFDHIQTIRIGTKSISFWPYRYVTDEDADNTLRLFEKIVKRGKHLAIMAHYEHWQELDTPVATEAIRRIRSTGAQIRTQAPVVRHINDSAETWAKMLQMQVSLGCIPYYMFVERQTGAKKYFEIPLVRVLEIYREAVKQVSGLARTIRGPLMSALPGKVAIDGVAEIAGEKVFVLSFLQGRDPDWCKRPFFASFNPDATWLNNLKPAFGEDKFFYENQLEEILTRQKLF